LVKAQSISMIKVVERNKVFVHSMNASYQGQCNNSEKIIKLLC
jgi:hypothetical protein